MLQQAPQQKISVEQILKSVATVFQVRVSDLKGSIRTKEIALPRQVAMYLAYRMINESLRCLELLLAKRIRQFSMRARTLRRKSQAMRRSGARLAWLNAVSTHSPTF